MLATHSGSFIYSVETCLPAKRLATGSDICRTGDTSKSPLYWAAET
jgi:hypothetical protein